MKKYCPTCKKEKDYKEFSPGKGRYDGLQSICRECKRNYDKQWYSKKPQEFRDKKFAKQQKLRRSKLQFIVDYLKLHPCVDCGESNPIVLEFDHCKGQKDFTICDGIHHSLKRIQNEIKKCEVRCANCHRQRTATQLGWYHGIIF